MGVLLGTPYLLSGRSSSMVCLRGRGRPHFVGGGRNDTMLSLDDFWWYLMVFDVFDCVWTIVVITKDNASVVNATNEQIV